MAAVRPATTLLVGVVVDEVAAAGQVRQAETCRVEVDAGDVQRRLAGFVERQLERVAREQVDAVEGRVLSRRGDLVQDVVVLLDQVGAGRRALASTTGADTGKPLNRPPGAAAVPVIAPIVDEAASFVVVIVSVPFEASVACRLFAASAVLRSLSVLTCPAPVTEGDVGRGAAAGRREESVRPLSCDGPVPRACDTGALKPSAAKAAVFELEIERSLLVPVCSTTWPARDGRRNRAGAGVAGQRVDLGQQVTDGVADVDVGAVGSARGHEGQVLTVHGDGVADTERRPQRVARGAGSAGEQRRGSDRGCRSRRAGHRGGGSAAEAELGQRARQRTGQADVAGGAGGQADLARGVDGRSYRRSPC